MSDELARARERGATIKPIVPAPQQIEIAGLAEIVQGQVDHTCQVLSQITELISNMARSEDPVNVNVQVELTELKEAIIGALKPCAYTVEFDRDERGRIASGVRVEPA
ncbi:MAG: hypothetical protein E4H01_03935 [Lysobacterales bacterium]|nr:MAG: hypothetical protein E4H01_03935 [Xanthomonadales bacterium]